MKVDSQDHLYQVPEEVLTEVQLPSELINKMIAIANLQLELAEKKEELQTELKPIIAAQSEVLAGFEKKN